MDGEPRSVLPGPRCTREPITARRAQSHTDRSELGRAQKSAGARGRPLGPGAHLDGADRAVSAPLRYRAHFPGFPGRIVRRGGLSVPGRSARSRAPLQPTCGRPHLHQALGEEAALAPQVSAQPAPSWARAHLPDHVSRRQAQLALLLRAVCGQDQHLCGRTGRVLGSVQSTRGRRRAGRGSRRFPRRPEEPPQPLRTYP